MSSNAETYIKYLYYLIFLIAFGWSSWAISGWMRTHIQLAMTEEHIEHMLTQMYIQHGIQQIPYSESSQQLADMKERAAQLRILFRGKEWTCQDIWVYCYAHFEACRMISSMTTLFLGLVGHVHTWIQSNYILAKHLSEGTIDTHNLGRVLGHSLWMIYIVLLYRGMQSMRNLFRLFSRPVFIETPSPYLEIRPSTSRSRSSRSQSRSRYEQVPKMNISGQPTSRANAYISPQNGN
jgi:hypothetical protein